MLLKIYISTIMNIGTNFRKIVYSDFNIIYLTELKNRLLKVTVMDIFKELLRSEYNFSMSIII